MLERFTGDEGKRLLVDSLLDQSTISGNADIANHIAERCELAEYADGEELIREGDSDNHLYFILSGSVSILVHNRHVSDRHAKQHVGELALIDPAESRSATVVARGVAVAAKLSEPKFTEIASKFPELWRRMAKEIAVRLRQRNSLVRDINEKPVLFIGSSSEALPIAKEIQSDLSYDNVIAKIWTHDVFRASKFPIEDLENQLLQSDFAVLILTPDDVVISRDKTISAPRDNVVLELGLFIGGIGRERTFICSPRGLDIKIPSDLLGINTLNYPPDDSQDLATLLGPTCTELSKLIKKLGPR